MTFRDIILTIVRLDNQTNKMQILRLNNYSLKKAYVFWESNEWQSTCKMWVTYQIISKICLWRIPIYYIAIFNVMIVKNKMYRPWNKLKLKLYCVRLFIYVFSNDFWYISNTNSYELGNRHYAKDMFVHNIKDLCKSNWICKHQISLNLKSI